MVPNGVLPSAGLIPPGNPLTSQPTPVSLLLMTVAVKGCVVPVVTVIVGGATLTATRAREPPLIGAEPVPPQPTRTSIMLKAAVTAKPSWVFLNIGGSEMNCATASRSLIVMVLIVMVLIVMVLIVMVLIVMIRIDGPL